LHSPEGITAFDDYVGQEPNKVEKHWSTLWHFMHCLSLFVTTQATVDWWSWDS